MAIAANIVVDIETVGLPVEDFDESELTYLAKNDETPGESLTKFALSPLTCQVMCIGMENPDTGGSKILSLGESTDPIATFFGDREADMLAEAWRWIAKYNTVITFNGRRFDIPVLMHRSALLSVPISRFDLLGNRFRDSPHCDLLDQLTFYGAMKSYGLDFFCKRYGIASPKTTVTGADVGPMFDRGEYAEIARYNARDIHATALLYKEVWLRRLRKTAK